jgi:predicted O-linked N-acetylglucosamine transferase (SPINDLY family)
LISFEELLRHAATFHQAGQYAEAEELYLSILGAEPRHPDANHNLGLLAMQLGQPERALPFLQTAWEVDPSVGQYWLTLAECLLALGHFEDAQRLVDEAAKRGMKTPQVQQLRLLAKRGRQKTAPPAALSEQALALFRAGRNAELESHVLPLLDQYPGWVLGWSALGAALQLQDKDAESVLRRAAWLAPADAEVQNNLGAFLRKRGRLDEAVDSLLAAIRLKPSFAEAHYNLGATLADLMRSDEAMESLRRAVELRPEHAEAWHCMGALYSSMYRFDDAIASFRKALENKPDWIEVRGDMGTALHGQGRISEARDCYCRAMEAKPELASIYSNYLFFLSHDESSGAEKIFREHCKYGDRFETPLRGEWGGYLNTPDPERPLHVGFVSADFYHHAVANFIEPIVRQMSINSGFVLHAYSNRAMEDETTLRLKGYFTHWDMVVGLSDEALARKIRAGGIDILIDLSGHTGHNRLLTFARKPAPVQASWIGYAGTTGLRAMDYYITDRFFLPKGMFDNYFTEKIVRLSASVPFLPSKYAPPVNDLPALGNGYITFGSFNRLSKISHAVVALWSRLLRELPDSRMLLGGMPLDGGHGKLIEWFAREGITIDRLEFHPISGMNAYLGLHRKVDICLDTFPYNGGTTTFHALWMGVPTLTLAGETPAARSGASILGQAGLDEFVVRDAADFVEKGKYWADHLAELSELRAGLRERFAQTASGHPRVVAEEIEKALRAMWRRWCAGLPPESFQVDCRGSFDVVEESA